MAEETEKVKKAKQHAEAFTLQRVPTQVAIVIKDSQTGQELSLEEAIVRVLNDLDSIKRSIIGG